MVVVPESWVANGSEGVGGPVFGVDSFGNNVEHEEGLEGFEVTWLEQEAFELWVESSLESFISWREDGDVVFAHGFFESL